MTAPAELVIEVTAGDIRLGDKYSSCLCPIARAVARLMGVPLSDVPAAVGSSYVLTFRPTGPDGTASYKLPAKAIDFIEAFDTGDAVEPFTFTARRSAS